MAQDLIDTIWLNCGTSLLWDANALNQVCQPTQVISMRDFLRLSQADWPEDRLHLVRGRTLVVAGLEAVLDSFTPELGIEWLETTLYPAILDFQESVADGGGEAALILWLADGRRLYHQAADNSYRWHCTGEHRNQTLPLGSHIWNGAQGSVRRIMTQTTQKSFLYSGLFLQRIS